ncbi:hypothetical protein OG747_35595 [Streptomyces sp. NBC_01384]|uniref:hypothetical protein n=1 Tax=Streptomyces sp. NBC_01384 TaxID=2903847 RepID=UPI00324A88C6
MSFRTTTAIDHVEDDSFAAEGYDAGDWAEVSVPGHWVLQGHGSPISASVRCSARRWSRGWGPTTTRTSSGRARCSRER